jgi:hypothetical protein
VLENSQSGLGEFVSSPNKYQLKFAVVTIKMSPLSEALTLTA